jgi:hypothetical protein
VAIILKANKVNFFVSFVLFVFWYHSPKFLDTPYILLISHFYFVPILRMSGPVPAISHIHS